MTIMKIMVLVLLVPVAVLAQELRPRSVFNHEKDAIARGGRVLSVRNEVGFNERYPGGTNEFGRTFAQQDKYEANFDLKSFVGFEFGRVYPDSDWYVLHQLNRPFRNFKNARLNPTGSAGRERLMRVMLEESFDGVSHESLSNEVDKISRLFAKKYGLCSDPFYLNGVYGFHFVTSNASLEVEAHFDRSPFLRVWATNWRVFNEEEERARVVSRSGKRIDMSEDEGADVLTANAYGIALPLKTEQDELPTLLETISNRLDRSFLKRYPLGTNEFGRTRLQQRAYEREEAEKNRKLKESWPKKLSRELRDQIVKQTEEKFGCEFAGFFGKTNTWQSGQGKSLLLWDDRAGGKLLYKLDSEGRVVRVSSMSYPDFEELKYYDMEAKNALVGLREKWASEHGMSLEDAEKKFGEQIRSGRGTLHRFPTIYAQGGLHRRVTRSYHQQESNQSTLEEREEDFKNRYGGK